MGGRHVRRLALTTGLPEDALGGGARVTLTGRTAALVEGQRGVIELSSGRIRLKTDGGVLTVSGEGLRLRELSFDAAVIVGEDVLGASYAKTPGQGAVP